MLCFLHPRVILDSWGHSSTNKKAKYLIKGSGKAKYHIMKRREKILLSNDENRVFLIIRRFQPRSSKILFVNEESCLKKRIRLGFGRPNILPNGDSIEFVGFFSGEHESEWSFSDPIHSH